MATFSNSEFRINSRCLLEDSLKANFKFICKDGIVTENKLNFVDHVFGLSKFWSKLFDSCCELEAIFLPDIRKEALIQTLNLLFTGATKGKESEFEEFYETLLYLFNDIPGQFSNITTNDFVRKSVKVIKQKKSTFSVDKGNVCHICLEYFSSKTAKDMHIVNHHKQSKQFQCNECESSFKTESGLKTHIKAKHKGTQRHICETCGITYKNLESLLRHCRLKNHSEPLRKKTIQIEFTKCTICFKLVKDIDYHHDVYHSVTSLHQCRKCLFKTKHKDNLLRHERRVHNMFNKQVGAIPKYLEKHADWTCHDCGKILSNEKDIENHLIMKCSEERNTCQLCGETFSVHYNLKRHMKIVHGNNNIQQYSCEKCGKKFKLKFSQQRHQAKCRGTA